AGFPACTSEVLDVQAGKPAPQGGSPGSGRARGRQADPLRRRAV
ncbi:MAG: hypothetical protein AVDCRST_MAG64-3251, partial [uncultured Phycisphaerae bacterium]